MVDSGKKSGLMPVLLSLLVSGILLGVVIERAPLLALFSDKTASTAPNRDTRGLGPAKSTVAPGSAPAASSVVGLVRVPNVTCWTATVAQQAIEGAGLNFVSHAAANATVPKDVVYRTDPAAGRDLPLGSVVKVTVSTGPPQASGRVMPVPVSSACSPRDISFRSHHIRIHNASNAENSSARRTSGNQAQRQEQHADDRPDRRAVPRRIGGIDQSGDDWPAYQPAIEQKPKQDSRRRAEVPRTRPKDDQGKEAGRHQGQAEHPADQPEPNPARMVAHSENDG